MNDATFKECKFSAAIVPYMYAELPGAERSAFESHLLECTACTDDFASISHARFEVYDWKKVEFDGLATPPIEIPFKDVAIGSTWTEKIHAVFARQWRIPGLAFAGLAVVAVFAVVFLQSNENPGDSVAQVNGLNAPAMSESAGAKILESDTVRGEQPEQEAVSGRQTKPVRAAAPPQVVQRPRRVTRNTKPAAPQRSGEARASTQDPRRNAPTLNEFADDEDTSLRLAELFDNIGTRD